MITENKITEVVITTSEIATYKLTTTTDFANYEKYLENKTNKKFTKNKLSDKLKYSFPQKEENKFYAIVPKAEYVGFGKMKAKLEKIIVENKLELDSDLILGNTIFTHHFSTQDESLEFFLLEQSYAKTIIPIADGRAKKACQIIKDPDPTDPKENNLKQEVINLFSLIFPYKKTNTFVINQSSPTKKEISEQLQKNIEKNFRDIECALDIYGKLFLFDFDNIT